MSKAGLLDRIRVGHELFKALLAELGDEQLTQAGVIGEWSVKDILVHIVVHEQRMLQWMAERMFVGTPVAFQPYGMPDPELAEVNERIYQENRDREWVNVLQDWDQAYAHTLAFVEAAAEEDLMGTHRFQLQGGEALGEAVAANTFEHCEEHSRDIRAWLARQRLGLVSIRPSRRAGEAGR
jgi:hypothetical protein